QKIFDLLKKEKGDATVIMVSSDLDRLLTVTDRVGMMLDGKIIFDGTTEQAQNSNNEYVRQFVHGLTEGPL
ncbi:MAG TPA: ABC transporter ATP-binding protein, partial [Polyangiaceae bacterium]|nr:ABC transporter ATP-binding protein [Polyangiaceae bacterium]